ncbi:MULTISPECIES: flagellar motor switch protein FliN [unclassified Neptuniibacter]|uniref:flagellar motor switch protein FliN n=1 Tax=unclassified Neptuniibacter TaxID=2630693 RepID=UPI000C39D0D6|nr:MULTISPECIES: flagellar motor switch protein FliN [unclassified Neptuniibacter]MAY43612.1 flagellar motor switch protein FliN [Oceanospirillaceae bacterium]|tara:strand:- start:16101 stop:16538 length:438 start_codon:yes stop_codon:yes gene_type:complete
MSDETEDQQAMADEWAAAMEEQVTEEAGAVDPDELLAATGVTGESVELDELQDEGTPVSDPKLDVILDIPVTLSMQVGQTDIPISNLLQLNQGSVIELDRVAGEPLDVMVNGTLIAHGEVVVVNDRYGIRLTDVISPQERIKRLK